MDFMQKLAMTNRDRELRGCRSNLMFAQHFESFISTCYVLSPGKFLVQTCSRWSTKETRARFVNILLLGVNSDVELLILLQQL